MTELSNTARVELGVPSRHKGGCRLVDAARPCPEGAFCGGSLLGCYYLNCNDYLLETNE